ncbi:hypothetical protein [Thiohalocapsa sp. ML1]|uniref:hypothetical protein n=1 Tax=Thiohalocapsa sp. ML1 TaxID=1431688 RepID=UPI0007323C47|nr:hypothetical protein [Thiohalocapsa sp. ML1]
MFTDASLERLAPFGFKAGKGGTHAARTMMLPELRRLLEVTRGETDRTAYRAAVVEANALDKPTVKARKLTLSHLAQLYALADDICLFRALRRLWDSDPAGQPVLALQLALARDTLLRASAAAVLDAKPGDPVTREGMESLLNDWSGGRLSPRSVKAIAQRVNGSWTQAGYLKGRVRKVRSVPTVTPANTAYALFQAWLTGRSGRRLYGSDWVRILGLPEDRLVELTQSAAERGILVFRRTGDVMEVRFPGYLTPAEEETRSEQA